MGNAGRGGGALGAGGVTIERGEECSGHGLCFRHAIDDDDDDKDGNGKDDAGGESALTTKQHQIEFVARSVRVRAECVCSDGFFGVRCESRRCPGDGTCGEKGRCAETVGKCECQVGYGGSTCEIRLCPGKGKEACSGHGLCQEENATCTCENGWIGEGCSVVRLDLENERESDCFFLLFFFLIFLYLI